MRRIKRVLSLCMLVLLAAQLLVSPAFAVGESEGTEDAAQMLEVETQLMEAEPSSGGAYSSGGVSSEEEPSKNAPSSVDAPSESELSPGDETFSCSVEDCHGIVIPGYYSDAEDAWYLFLTSTEDIAEVVVQYSGQITEISKGILDQDNHCISNGFSASGDELILTDAAGEEIQLIAMQSQLPSRQITLNGTTLEEIHQDKDIKYSGNSLLLTEPTGEYNLTAENSVEVKGRGNSTWREYDKKPYQIKFNSKTSVLGMPKAKKWVLLANASDDSMMRSKLVYDMTNQMDMEYVTNFEYVDLWIDGAYLGTYLLGEKVEIAGNRLNLQNPEGVLCEHDNAFYEEEANWFYDDWIDGYFTLKESVEEDDSSVYLTGFDRFHQAVDALAEYLYTTDPKLVTMEKLESMIDVDSFVKYYLLTEYTMNRESYLTSFYWYQDGPEDVLHLGPVWDYDTCMGNNEITPSQYYVHECILLRHLLVCDVFMKRVQILKEQYAELFDALADNIDTLHDQVIDSAVMNYLRWDVLGTEDPKGGYFSDTYEEAVESLRTWLEERNACFAPTVLVESSVNGDCTEMPLCYYGGESLSGVRFAVWSLGRGQDDIRWYPAEQDEQGNWRAVVDLSNHESSGIYMIHVYSTQPQKEIAMAKEYVWKAVEKQNPMLDTTISVDNRNMELRVTHVDMVAPVWFAVWSETGGQDDLHWYLAQQEDGVWSTTVDLAAYQSTGRYYVHVYSGMQNSSGFQCGFTTTVAELPLPLPGAEAIVSDDCTVMDLALKYGDSDRQVLFAVWSEENGQDDLRWYPAELDDEGVWRYRVDLTEHQTAGIYQIHVYYENNSPGNLVAHTSAQVAFAVSGGPSVEAVVSEDCTVMDLTLANADGTEQMLFAVWSEENGQDDLHWYPAELDSAGVWRYQVDLATHQTAGTYLIHVYQGTNAPDRLIAHTTAEVSFVAQPGPEVKAVVSDDGSGIQVTVSHAESGNQLWIAVWSEENGQDDLQWYLAEQDADGAWNCNVSLSQYCSIGCYQIHVYDGDTFPETFLTHTSVAVENISSPAPVVIADVSENGSMMMTLENAETETNVWFAVWSEENDQDDLQWYPAEKNGAVWSYTADLESHSSYGNYLIHIYSGEEMPRELIAHTTALYEER